MKSKPFCELLCKYYEYICVNPGPSDACIRAFEYANVLRGDPRDGILGDVPERKNGPA